MRVFEVLLLISVIISVVNLFFIKCKKIRFILPTQLILFCALSIIFEGCRIQMYPAYLLVFILFSIDLINKFKGPFKVRRGIKIATIPVFILFTIIATAFPMLFPVAVLPDPDGIYSVGTMNMSFTDKSRKGIFTDSNQYREIAVQVWYPTDDIVGKEAVNFISNKECTTYMAERLELPNIFDHLALVKTHSYLNADLSVKESKYPIIFFSSGYGSFVGQNTIQMEALASQGYIVFSISHPYEDFVSIFPNGELIRFNSNQLSTFQNELSSVSMDYEGNKTSGDFEKFAIVNCKIAYDSVHIWSDDTIFVADQIEMLNAGENNSIFENKLDISNIGIFGHSFGGATAGQVCLEDSRFKAFINLDGTPFGDVVNSIIEQPFMIMNGDTDKNLIKAGYSVEQQNYMVVTINGASHSDFMDFTVLLPTFRYIGMLGDIGGTRQEDIMNDYVIAFFNKYLKGTKEALIDEGLNKYSEVMVEYK